MRERFGARTSTCRCIGSCSQECCARTVPVTIDEGAEANAQSLNSSAMGHSIYAPSEVEFKCYTDKDADVLSAISSAWHTGILGLASDFPSAERTPSHELVSHRTLVS
jgi:hypothetical protein